MRIGIIGAMGEEISYILSVMKEINKRSLGRYLFYEGIIHGHNLVVVQGGIGKVASGIVYSTLLHHYPDLDLTINIGVCGGVAGKGQIGDVIVPRFLAYADVDLRVFPEFSYGQMANCPAVFKTSYQYLEKLCLPFNTQGTILSGDLFFSNGDKINNIIKLFPKHDILGFDMESTPLAQAAYLFQKDFIVIRAISDIIGGRKQTDDYKGNLEQAALNAKMFLLELLKVI